MVSAASSTKQRTSEGNGSERGGFCGALQRTPPPLPAALARRLSNKENVGFGRVSFFFAFNVLYISLFLDLKKKKK